MKTKKSNSVVDKADNILNVVNARLNDLGDDEFTIVGKNVAAKLRKLSRETKIYTEKLINDILFQAELGKITEHTKIITENIQPTPTCSTFGYDQQNSHCNENVYHFPNVEHSPQSSTAMYFSKYNPI